jgi:ubiquinone/menaquinone biosynthesis C-methylase UbiE
MPPQNDTHEPRALTSRTAVAYFDSHAEYYEKNQYRTSRRTFVNGRHDQIVAILAGLDVPAGATVLDAGCGPGNLLPEFARRFRRVVAMDASPGMLRVARSRAVSFGNVEYRAGDIEALPFADASIDLVCSAGVIEYLPRVDRVLAEMYRVLRPGGMLILPTTNLLAPAHWFRRLTESMVRIPAVARAFGLEPGSYRLWYHFIPRFKRRLGSAGFVLLRERHFYLTLPRPLDRLLPGPARRVEQFFNRYMSSSLGHLAEGYLAVARKPALATVTANAGNQGRR